MGGTVKGGSKAPGAAAEGNVDGSAAADRLPPDGCGDVPDALLLQVAGPATRQEGRGRADCFPKSFGRAHSSRREAHGRRYGAPLAPAATPTPDAPPPPAPAAEAAEAAAETVPLPVGATPQKAEPAFVIETDLYKIAFSNQGGTVRSWQLKKTNGNDLKTLDLVNSAAGMDFPYSLYFPNQKPLVNVNFTWYKQTAEPDGLG